MFTHNLALALALVITSAAAEAPSPRLGQPLSAAEVRQWDISVFPDGTGLPPGAGSVAQGETLYQAQGQCIACHGPGGIGLTADALAGAEEPLDSEWPDKTIGSYWPYATTLFDFIRRAKPMHSPGTLSSDQVYALVAYLLYLNGLVEPDAVLDAKTLPGIRMPNRNGFVSIDAIP